MTIAEVATPPQTTGGVRILMVDPQSMLLQGIAACLQSSGIAVVGQSSDPANAVNLIRKHDPDIAVFELLYSNTCGIDLAARAIAAHPRTRIMILTGLTGAARVREAFQSGVAGYVLKTQPVADLVQAITLVSAGCEYLSPYLAASVAKSASTDLAHTHVLTPREREVIRLIARGLSTKEVAATLGIGAKTAATHRAHIMTKLDVHNAVGLVEYALAVGLHQVQYQGWPHTVSGRQAIPSS